MTNNNIDNDNAGKDLKAIVSAELQKKGSSGQWLWKLFFICLVPIILNGFHVNSYIFLAKESSSYFCNVDVLNRSGWTDDQVRNFTSSARSYYATRHCTLLDYDYSRFEGATFEDASLIVAKETEPAEVGCKANDPRNAYKFDQIEGESMVSEFELVCENLVMRSNIQLAISLGKFVGSFVSGLFSDRFGRKTTFVLGCVLYVVSGLETVFAKDYWTLFFGRFGLGVSAAALFLANFTLLTENISPKNRSWMSIVYTISYPIGMICLAGFASILPLWRDLQLALIAPGLLFIVPCYLMDESPRWLISKGEYKRAYKILFGRHPPETLTQNSTTTETNSVVASTSCFTRFRNSFAITMNLFKDSKLRKYIMICFFTWCITSTSYYVTALNASIGNEVLYVLYVGLVDLPTCILPVLLLRFFGRRISASVIYLLTGTFLLAVICTEADNLKLLFAMFGRFGISAVYVVITLHTAELFPTDVRSSALGTCVTVAHIGSIIAPYIVDLLGAIASYIPNTICGTLALCAGLLVLLLPETKDKHLTDHVGNGGEEGTVKLEGEKVQ